MNQMITHEVEDCWMSGNYSMINKIIVKLNKMLNKSRYASINYYVGFSLGLFPHGFKISSL